MKRTFVALPGNPAVVKGIDMYLGPLGSARGDLLEPQEITMSLIDSTMMKVNVRSSSIICTKGLVSDVVVQRPLRVASFKDVKADLIHILTDLKIKPDKPMKERMDTWPDDTSNGDIYTAGLHTPFHGLLLDVRVSPDYQGGWYYLLFFHAVTDADRAMLAPSTQPTTLSSEAPGTQPH